jgi:hypothetical protein
MSDGEFATLLDQVVEIKKEVKAKKRDVWDVAALVSQFVSAVLLGLAGFALNYYTNIHQAQFNDANARTQTTMAKQARLLDYLKAIADAHSDDDKRARLVASAGLAIPDDAAIIAKYYAAKDQSDEVREAAIDVLAEQHEDGALTTIASSGRLPDADHARQKLGEVVKNIRVRLSDIDDIGKLVVNAREVLAQPGHDSAWEDVTSAFHPGSNEVVFILINGPYGGFSGRFQLIAGSLVYDSGTVRSNSCPCDAPAFEIRLQVQVSTKGQVEKITSTPVKFF